MSKSFPRFNIEHCKRGDWAVVETVKTDAGDFYLLADASGRYGEKQLADSAGRIVNDCIYAQSFTAYATICRWLGTDAEKELSAAYRRSLIDSFRRDFPAADKYFFQAWVKRETEAEARERLSRQYAAAGESVELAAYAYKQHGVSPYDAQDLFGKKFLGFCQLALGDVDTDFLYYMEEREKLDRIWRLLVEMQQAHDREINF